MGKVLKMLKKNILKRSFLIKIFLVMVIFTFVSCPAPTTRSSAQVGDADHSGGQESVGSNDKLFPPDSLMVVNNGTGSEKYLELQWSTVPGATMYTIYRAVYPTHAHPNGSLMDKAYKKLVEIPAQAFLASTMTYCDEIPRLPLRRYSYVITARNENGETAFSNPVDGYRVPIDQEEALLDIDYTIHFVQSSTPGFGQAFKEAKVQDRPKTGTYHYSSKIGNIKSHFYNYGDFETILATSGDFNMQQEGLGSKMNGPINVSGLYNATLTYHNFVGALKGLSRSGTITITYEHPQKGRLFKEYSFEEARRLMKTVAYDEGEKQPRPPASEWDEADPSYTRRAQEIARRSVLNNK